MQKHYTVYKVTNTVNHKFYIGQHQTFNVTDGYLGSGTAIKSAIKKYGCGVFVKKVLHVFDNFDEMNAAEQALVTEELVNNPQCYNQAPGGQFANLSKKQKYVRTPEHCKKLGDVHRGKKKDPDVVSRRAKTCKENRAKMTQEERNVRFGLTGERNGFYNKSHSDPTKQKVRETIGDSMEGSNNANAKSITVDGVTYQTHKECMEQLGLSKRQLKKLKQSLGESTMNKIGEAQC